MICFSDNSKRATCWANRFWQTHCPAATIGALVGLFLMLVASQRCTAESRYDYDAFHCSVSANQITGQPTSHTLHRTCDPSFHIVAAAGIINRQYSDDRFRLPSIVLQIHLRCFKPDYDAPLNNVAETYQPSAQNEMSLYRGYFATVGVDPSGTCKCKVLSGPTYTPSGSIESHYVLVAAGENENGRFDGLIGKRAIEFTQQAHFSDDRRNGYSAKCCVVSQNVKIDDGPWEEDSGRRQGSPDERFGHREDEADPGSGFYDRPNDGQKRKFYLVFRVGRS